MRQRHSRPSLPRARSPIKTHLQSPARQNPHIGPTSSPFRGSVIAAPEPTPPKAVNRRLDFSKSAQSKLKAAAAVNGNSKVNGTKGPKGKLVNGRAQPNLFDEEELVVRGQVARRQVPEPEDEEEEEDEESMQILDAGGDEMGNINDEQDVSAEPEPEPEEDDEESVQQPKPAQQLKGRRGRKPKSPIAQAEEAEPLIVEANDEPAQKRRGRPAKNVKSPEQQGPQTKSQKRGRPARNSAGSNNDDQEQEQEQGQDEEDIVDERQTKKQRTEIKESRGAPSKPTATKEKGKPGRKRKSSGIGVDEPVVQRGPPLPKGRGLVALRREDEDTMRITRSGRHSYKPLDYWKGEHILYDDATQHIVEDKGQRFVMPGVKGVVRTVEANTSAPRRRRGRPSKQNGATRRATTIIEEEEVERDDWEYNPGHLSGDCVFWRPEHELQPPDEDEPELLEHELAVSEAAIQLKDIKDATFRFAKTLTMPFFGSGIVDMPPGSEKRTKNSRKMQMVFFVHTGSVEVTVAQNEFRIAKGGMWFVPRGTFFATLPPPLPQVLSLTAIPPGNHYSISNPHDKSARIFFSQGCEVLVQADEEGEEA